MFGVDWFVQCWHWWLIDWMWHLDWSNIKSHDCTEYYWFWIEKIASTVAQEYNWTRLFATQCPRVEISIKQAVFWYPGFTGVIVSYGCFRCSSDNKVSSMSWKNIKVVVPLFTFPLKSLKCANPLLKDACPYWVWVTLPMFCICPKRMIYANAKSKVHFKRF